MGSYAGAMGYGQFIPSSYRAYAIDYDKDGFADIWNNTDDAIGSVANYFKVHGWKSNHEVAVRSRVTDNFDESVINKSLKPTTTIEDLSKKGFTPVKTLSDTANATAMRLQGEWGAEFWLGLHNFYVITRYNHSRLYAMAVWQLSQEIAAQKTSS
jgi:membrane-bound lytic murein transglycosylase B